jgi:hypothetical protein
VDGTQDPDGDGYTTFKEYVLGTDPTSSASFLNLSLQASPGAISVVFSPFQAGRVYQLQGSDALGPNSHWSNLATQPATANANGQGVLTLVNLPPAQKFLRLSVQLAP